MATENERFERYREHIEKAAVKKYRDELFAKVVAAHKLLESLELTPASGKISQEELTAVRYGAMFEMLGVGGYLFEALPRSYKKHGESDEVIEELKGKVGLKTDPFEMVDSIMNSAVNSYVREVVDAEE